MNKGTVTKLKNWLVANFNIKLVESSSTDGFYLTNDSVSIRISDHIQGSDFNKIRFDISIILPEETNQYIVSIGYKVYNFIDNKGVIYKYIFNKNHFVKLTHWSIGEERRVDVESLSKEYNNKELKELKQTKACELTNKYWNSLTREWEYNGKKYKALSKEDRELYYPNIRPKAHKFKSKEVGYRPTFWIGLYQNRIVWYTIFPEGCVILKVHSIDIEPIISSDWIGYVSENGIQPILDCETNEFL